MSIDSAPQIPRPSRRITVSLVLVVLFVLAVPEPVDAHPGRTDGNGCHTCRTNCTQSWGIPYGYYHRHHPVRDCFSSSPTSPPPPTTTTTRPTTTTSQQTTTTRAPPRLDGDSLSSQLRSVRREILDSSSELISANQLWESGEISYAETHNSFLQVAADVSDLRVAVEGQRTQADNGATYEALAEALEDLEEATAGVVAGLEAPDTGQARAEALDSWILAVVAFDSLVLDLMPTTTTSSSTTAPTESATSLEGTTTSTSISTVVEAGSPTDDNGGWILMVIAVGGLAYWLGRRRGPTS